MSIERWEIDSNHSGVHFSVRHMVVARVRGTFSRWTGSLTVPDGAFGRASVEVAIEAASIDTGAPERDGHLRSADFFDVAKHPSITFRSTRVEPVGADHYKLVGDLSMHGVTREVPLEVEYAGRTQDPWGHARSGFTAKTSVNRKDFGLDWNQVLEAGGVLVGENIEIEIEVEAVLQSPVAVG
jgi:polyisoprenoid-binding protein YceI